MARWRVTPGLRRVLLAAGVLFASVLAAAVVSGPGEEGGDSASSAPAEALIRSRGGRASGVAAPQRPDDLERQLDLVMRRSQDDAQVQDLFPERSWQPPPPPPPPPPVATKPAAPPLPFAYMGSLVDEGQRTVFLSSGERIVAVKVADTIDGIYRVDDITARQMTLTYLPLKQQQTIALGEAR